MIDIRKLSIVYGPLGSSVSSWKIKSTTLLDALRDVLIGYSSVQMLMF